VIQKIAAVHGATFEEVSPVPERRCYRLTFPPLATAGEGTG
jgi:hypothetical protein